MKKITAILPEKRNAVLTEVINGCKDEQVAIISINKGESDITEKIVMAIKKYFNCEDVRFTKDHNFKGFFILQFDVEIFDDGIKTHSCCFRIEDLETY